MTTGKFEKWISILWEGEPVTVAANGGLAVKTARRKYRLGQLVFRITAKNRHDETGWGKPQGKEFW